MSLKYEPASEPLHISHPEPGTLHQGLELRDDDDDDERFSTLNPQPYTLHPTPYTLTPKPSTLNPQPYTRTPNPLTLNP